MVDALAIVCLEDGLLLSIIRLDVNRFGTFVPDGEAEAEWVGVYETLGDAIADAFEEPLPEPAAP